MKAMDSVTDANFERKDLSNVITKKDGPPRPFLQAIGDGIPAKGKTHYWDEVGLNQIGRGQATYAEGAKPASQTNAPAQLSNVICRTGQVARVTDTMTAIWQGAGAYCLADGEMERLIQEAIDLDTALKTEEILLEMEWMLLNGDSANTETWAGGQCDGVVKILTVNKIVETNLDTSKAGAAVFETEVQKLAKQIKLGYAPAVPNLVLCTTPSKVGINAFIGGGAGRPIVQVVTPESAGYVAGQAVDKYQTGFFTVDVVIEPQLEVTALGGKTTPPTTANLLMLSTKRFKRADLIPLRTEPLARINTSVERMITSEYTLEYRNIKESGQLTGLVA